ncbi:MAG: hypothetical protein LBO78_03465 [Rickettsiales bacterium]|jgi:hypothetical protein|nr:hypothetical protein [Rickettsiales bacterium]
MKYYVTIEEIEGINAIVIRSDSKSSVKDGIADMCGVLEHGSAGLPVISISGSRITAIMSINRILATTAKNR